VNLLTDTTNYFDDQTDQLQAEIEARPPSLPLPHKNDVFVALRPVEAEVGIYFREPSIDLDLPVYVVKWTLPPGETFSLEYEPNHAGSTHCSLRPIRYVELEAVLVDRENRRGEFYSHYSVSVSYTDLAAGFQWKSGRGSTLEEARRD